MKILSILTIACCALIIRLSRWLSIVQQKEYRLDRLISFLQTAEGRAECWRIIPRGSDFSRQGFRRPKPTGRSIFVLLCFSLLLLIVVIFTWALLVSIAAQYSMIIAGFLVLLAVVGIVAVLPLMIILSIFPSTLIAHIVTQIQLRRASHLIRSHKPFIIGITGSYGKTSTKLLLAHVLSQSPSVWSTKKSHNTAFSISRAVVEGYEHESLMVIEYAAYKRGEIARIASFIKPDMAILTGLTPQHLGLFGSIDAIIDAKAELVRSLPQHAVVICNEWEPKTQKIFTEGSREEQALQYFGIRMENLAELGITAPILDFHGHLSFTYEGHSVKTKLLGMHYLQIVALVIAAARKLELSSDLIRVGLSSFIPTNNFITTRSHISGACIIDDGKTANKAGFIAAVELARSYSAKRKILITGGIVDLGKQSEEIHRELAQLCSQVFDLVIYVNDVEKTVFASVLGDSYVSVTSSVEMQKALSQVTSADLLIIEGKLPKYASDLF